MASPEQSHVVSQKGKVKGSPPPPVGGKGKESTKSNWRDLLPKMEIWSPSPSNIVIDQAALYDIKLADMTFAAGVDEGPEEKLKLICFDFDKTLASIHLYNSMCIGGSAEAEIFAKYKARFEIDSRDAEVFGGSERLEMLRLQLRCLKNAGAKLYIVTMGSPHLVDHCLQRCDLQSFFEGISEDNPKQTAVQALMNTRFTNRLRADQAILVDDTPSNLMNATIQEQLPDELRFTHAENAERFFQRFYLQARGYDRVKWNSCFELGVICPSGQGYCKAMLVSDTGISQVEFETLLAAVAVE